MKNVVTTEQQSRLLPTSYFLLRTPSLPLDLVAKQSGDLSSAWRLDDATLSRPIEVWTESSDRLAVLELSKPSFAEVIRREVLDLDVKRIKLQKSVGVAASARRFLLRASTRPTPRAMFANTQLGRVGDFTRLSALTLSDARPAVRVSYPALLAIGGKLGSEVSFLRSALLFTNPTLRAAGSGYRYLERHTDGVREFSYAVAQVDSGELVDTILAASGKGVSWLSLHSILLAKGISAEDANGVVREALRCQLIQCDLLPRVMEVNPIARWLGQLSGSDESDLKDAIVKVDRMSRAAAGVDLAGAVAAAKNLAAAVSEAAAPARIGEAVHIETVATESISALARSLIPGLVEAIEAAAAVSVSSGLRRFETELAREMTVKFGDGDIPFLELVDSWAGHADFGALADHPDLVRIAGALAESQRLSLGEPQRQLLALAQTAIAAGRDSVDLGLLKGETVASSRLPNGLCATAALLQVGDSRRSDEYQWLFKSASRGLVSGLGRYASSSELVFRAAYELAALEEAQFPDDIVADVEFVSGPTSANVSMRPRIYRRSISAVGSVPISGNAGDDIPLSDLSVRVKGDHLELWSVSRGCRVRPRQASMQGLAPNRDLPLLVMLAALQSDGHADYLGPDFLWGPLWGTLPYLPRISFKRVLLARKYWNVTAADVPSISRGNLASLKAFVLKSRIPDCVAIVDRDQELPVLTSLDWGLREIAQHIVREGRVRLTEPILGLQEPILDASGASYAHEIVLPILRRPETPGIASNTAPRTVPTARASFLPLCVWVYVKVYCSKPAQALLMNRIGPWMKELVDDGSVSSWHFVRYSDYAPHLRLRCKVSLAGDEARVFGVLRDRLSREVDISTVPLEIGTYIPEVSRYGGALGMTLAEERFFESSRNSYDLAQKIESTSDTHERLAIAVLSTIRHIIPVLADTEILLQASQDAVRRYERTLDGEMRDTVKATESRLSRSLRSSIEAQECLGLLTRLENKDFAHFEAEHGVDARLAVSSFLRSKELQFQRTWIMDIVHMHLNRICGAGDRATEYLCFSVIARQVRAVRAIASAN